MPVVVLVIPYFQGNSLRYLEALADLKGISAAVISSDPEDLLAPTLRKRIAGHYRVANCLDGGQLAAACKAIARSLGPIQRLLGIMEQLQLPLAEARELAGIPGMNGRVARNFRDKAYMKKVLREAGLPCARSRLIECDEDARKLADEVGFPIVVKPVDGLGTRATWRINDETELQNVLKSLRPSLDRPFQGEEFVAGSEHTCEAVTVNGRPVWQCGTHYLPGPLEVLENPWMQYCVLLPRESDLPLFRDFWPINTAALTALGMDTGLTHMEWFVRRDGTPCISEVGARPPGVQIMPQMSLAHETDMVASWVNLMVNGVFTPVERKWSVGVAFLRGQGAGKHVKGVYGLERADDVMGQFVVERSLPRIGQARADGYEGEGWVIVKAADTATCRQALRDLVTRVRVELE